MKLKQLFTLIIAGFFSIGLFAAEVDIKKSEIKWKVDKKLGKGHYGTVPISSAKATLKDGKIQSGEIVLDMKNFDVTDLSGEWKTKFLNHVRSGDFFQADKYPTATLTITEQVGKDKVKAKLKIKDKTHPVEISFKNKGKEYTGKFVFDRTKWGINYGSGSIFSTLKADKVIKDEIELDFKIVLK
jgi:polyisoprenoid-binding protein YceI